ncbi:MAG: alpha/beta fold hydrolase [Gemmatimonadaceae bacterium]
MTRTRCWAVAALAVVPWVLAPSSHAQSSETGQAIVTEEFRIPAVDPGVELYVRNKHLPSPSQFPGDRVVLFVHGSTYPAETTFDLPLNGISWMDYIARHGYDVYLLDVRGYGRSTRPPEMDQSAETNSPIVRTETAVQDVGAAVEFIRRRRAVGRVNLLGWSWGTVLMATYTTRNNDKVGKLLLYAPQWIRTTAQLMAGTGAYRIVQEDAAKARWLTGVPEAKKADLIPPGWFEQWAAATFTSDPWGANQTPRKLRAPNGTLQDTREYWTAGKPYYEPENIRVPTLLVVGEWDRDNPPYLAQTLFPRVINAPYKQLVQIGEATHTMMLEKNRMQLFRAVQAFLDDPAPSP